MCEEAGIVDQYYAAAYGAMCGGGGDGMKVFRPHSCRPPAPSKKKRAIRLPPSDPLHMWGRFFLMSHTSITAVHIYYTTKKESADTKNTKEKRLVKHKRKTPHFVFGELSTIVVDWFQRRSPFSALHRRCEPLLLKWQTLRLTNGLYIREE